MADDLIHCPSCNFRLRLPPDLSGQEVECPQCRTRFTAPVPSAGPPMRPPPGREYDATAPTATDAEYAPPSAAAGRVTAPAVALLIMSLLGVGADVLGLMWGQAAEQHRAEFEQALEKELDKNRDLTPQDRQQMKEMLSLDKIVQFLNLDCGISLALNVITALGAIQMLRRRTYGLGVLGCIVALNPANLPTCILQVPFALWGLIVLMNGDVKRSFR
jgi:hypothetical protein